QYPVSDKLFLTGYSEGGFSTMVMYEELLKSHPEIKVTAAAPGSAPYDWKETMKFVVDGDGPRSSLYLGLFFYSIQLYHHYWAGADTVFNKPYDTLIPYLYDGSHTTDEITAGMPKDPHTLMQDKFIDAMFNGTDPHLPELIANFNHFDFKSTSPLLLIGTKGDHDVPYHGAEIAYEALKKKSDKVYIRSVSDKLDHIQAFPFVTKGQLEFFQQY
ncbi:MAG TPA: alpha/beta hydrolase, partial [Gammaproteobacteria bacterium]|nr:alpha/beta hydrolase [Gammaproteobacteria bacterium]